MADGFWLLAGLGALLVVPPLAYLLWIRLAERYNRESVPSLLGSFGFGATAGIAIALLLNQLFAVGFNGSPFGASLQDVFIASVVCAPLVEELAKGVGMAVSRPYILEVEDGIIHGAAIGLGFAATENAIYAGQALLSGGLILSIQTTAMRAVSSMVLHATAAAFLGYGYSQVRVRGMSKLLMAPYYLFAAALHATYNFLVQLPDPLAWLGFGGALVATLSVALVLRHRVHVHDRAVVPPIWVAVTRPARAFETSPQPIPQLAPPVPLDPRLRQNHPRPPATRRPAPGKIRPVKPVAPVSARTATILLARRPSARKIA